MPQLGYGVFQVSPEEAERCVADALSIGYRMIDTAQAYQNEEGVGNAIRKSSIKREDIFVVDKIWMSAYEGDTPARSIDESLRKLGTDYIDLMLLHQPFGDRYNAYRALEDALKAGKVRAIGVSNFYPDRFIDLQAHVEVKPAVNQVELHVFNQQITTQKYMEKYGCQIMSWGPFAEGRNDFFNNETLSSIGKKYGKTVAQVALRYLLQRGVVLIPKSTHRERMEQNMNIFDFELVEEDMRTIEKLDTKQSLFFSHYDPEMVEFLISLVHA